MVSIRHFVLIVCCISYFHDVCSAQEYRHECRVWQDLIERMKDEDNLEVECLQNRQCTGFDCKGKYIYQGLYSLNKKYTMDICFGIFIRPCNKPKPNLHFYTELLETNSTFQRDVDHSDIYQIPGSHFELSSMMTGDGFVQVDMNDTSIYGQPAMEIGMFFKMRTTFLGQEHYPDDFKVTLIPDTIIPIPDCNERVVTPKHVPYTCGYDKPLLPVTTTTPAPPAYLPGNPCKPSNNWQELKKACGLHQKCVSSGAHDYCSCLENYIYNITTKMCVGTTPDTHEDGPVPIDFENPSDDSGLSKKMVTIIAVCAVGGLFILVAVVGAAVVKYQRYKRRYGQHDTLLNNDDDDPIEVAT